MRGEENEHISFHHRVHNYGGVIWYFGKDGFADDLRQFIAADTAGFVLAVFDGADEMYRGKVAEKFAWCGI